MKPLGPYVAARDLPGRMNSPVRTLRATDRLTGMPVLLHGLPAPQPVPDLPEHPNVLTPVECVEVAGEAFMVTELPLQARPAQDPELTAQGALAALTALHARGVVHGGLSASQLWSVDGEVRLAGAGLPWGGEARPADDLYALAVILQDLGGVPRALRSLLDEPGQLDAPSALLKLQSPSPAGPEAAAIPVEPEADLTAPGPAHPSPSPIPAPPRDTGEPERTSGEAGRQRGRDSRFRLPGLTGHVPAPAGNPVRPAAQSGPADPVGPEVPPAAPGPAAAMDAPPGAEAPATLSPGTPGPSAALAQPAHHPADPAPVEGGPDPLAPQPGPPATPGRETPQERRRREHEARREQAQLDAQAALARRSARAAPSRPAQTPVQIGFDDDLPAWEVDTPPPPRPPVQLRDVERLPASLRREALPAEPVAEPESTSLPARRRAGEPIRIGWDEDDSWRVVREAPAAPAGQRRPLVWRVLMWGGLALILLVLTLLLGKVLGVNGPDQTVSGARGAGSGGGQAVNAPPAAPQPQTVPFTVRGVAGATARLSVEQSPKEANLAPGAALGTAPGRVTFPAPGTYRLRVVVDGFAPGSMTVTVPRAQPVTIDLDR